MAKRVNKKKKLRIPIILRRRGRAKALVPFEIMKMMGEASRVPHRWYPGR